jgi:hypothetical protein
VTDLETAVRDDHDHLAATEEVPLEREATRWVAEAQAVAGDLRDVDDEAVIRERMGHVRDLLSNVDSTGDPAADEHVAVARETAAELSEESASP